MYAMVGNSEPKIEMFGACSLKDEGGQLLRCDN